MAAWDAGDVTGAHIYLRDASGERMLVSAREPLHLRRYHELTGYAPRKEALDLYRLEWRLADTAAFISVFRSTHAATADTEKTWLGLMLSWSA